MRHGLSPVIAKWATGLTYPPALAIVGRVVRTHKLAADRTMSEHMEAEMLKVAALLPMLHPKPSRDQRVKLMQQCRAVYVEMDQCDTGSGYMTPRRIVDTALARVRGCARMSLPKTTTTPAPAAGASRR